MEAAEAKIQRVLEGSKQFVVPHNQRPYSWKEEQWKTLWRDILELIEDPRFEAALPRVVVTSPARSVPEGVEKRLLIDGQQRLTTRQKLDRFVYDRVRSFLRRRNQVQTRGGRRYSREFVFGELGVVALNALPRSL